MRRCGSGVDAATDEERSVRTRLTVELVPRTCWFKNVRSEVSRDVWDRLRKETLEGAGHRCQVCGAVGRLECHEVWEYDDERHVQRLAELVTLCYRCHEVKHIGLAGVRGREERAMEHLARVNGWSREDVEAYVEAVFETWHWRSRHEWTLDLGWLERHGIARSR